MIERSSLGREFHNDGAAMANARSPNVTLDFTDGIARSKVLYINKQTKEKRKKEKKKKPMLGLI